MDKTAITLTKTINKEEGNPDDYIFAPKTFDKDGNEVKGYTRQENKDYINMVLYKNGTEIENRQIGDAYSVQKSLPGMYRVVFTWHGVSVEDTIEIK